MAETTPTVYFPDTIDFLWTPSRGKMFRTTVLELYNGAEQRLKQFDVGLEYWKATTGPLNIAAKKTLIEFLESRFGMWANFYFFRPDPMSYTDFPCGTVAASTTIIIPFKNSIITAVKVGGVSKAYTVQAGAGTGGEDQVTFTAGPQTGAVSVTLTGRRRMIVRYEFDDIAENFAEARDLLSTVSISVKELR